MSPFSKPPIEEHHLAPINRGGRVGRAISDTVRMRFGIDLSRYALNSQFFPRSAADAAAISTFRHSGRHLDAYAKSILAVVETIPDRTTLDRFLATVGDAINRGDLKPNTPAGSDGKAASRAIYEWFGITLQRDGKLNLADAGR